MEVASAWPVARTSDRPRRPEDSVAVEAGGSRVLALVIGKVGERWAPELASDLAPCKLARMAARAAAGESADAELAREGFVAGLVVLGGWQLARGPARHADIFALAQASEAFHGRRSGHRFFYHEVLASATFRDGNGAMPIVQQGCWRVAGVRRHCGLPAFLTEHVGLRVEETSGHSQESRRLLLRAS